MGEKKEYLLLNAPSWNDRMSSLRDGLYVERLMTILGEKARMRRTIEEEQHNKTRPRVESGFFASYWLLGHRFGLKEVGYSGWSRVPP